MSLSCRIDFTCISVSVSCEQVNLKILAASFYIDSTHHYTKTCLFGLIASNWTIIPEICCCDVFWCGEQCVLILVFVIVQYLVGGIAGQLFRARGSIFVCIWGYKTEFR